MKHIIFSFFAPLLFVSTFIQAEPVKIMPLGDSITWDWYYGDSRSDAYRHSYRNYLWYKLQDENLDVDFVGTKVNGGAISPSFDGNNEGYTGYTTYQIKGLIYGKLVTTSPDIILLHIGTNDSMYYSPYSMTGLEGILNEIDRYETNYQTHIKVILARIVPLPKAGTWVTNFNNSLDAMAQSRIASGDDITVVNMNVVTSLIDGIHPTASGYAQMADIWFLALQKAIDDINIQKAIPALIPVYGMLLN